MSKRETQQAIQHNQQGIAIAEIGGGQVVFNITYVSASEAESPSDAVAEGSETLGPNPYQGLEAFQEKDKDRFFGRTRHIDELWQQMQEIHERRDGVRLLPLYGPSGSGKSSLALAGLIPRLAEQPLAGYARAKYIRFFPDESPVNRLAGALAWALTDDALAIAKQREIAGELKQPNEAGQYDGLRRTANQFLDATGQPLIVLIDQFEELFTRCEDAAEQQIFVENLLVAAASSAKSLWVIVTLRSDFLGEVQAHSELSALFSSQGYLVPGLTTAELREAIAQPAEQAGYVFDEATVQLLIDQAADRTGALPLLQFALEQIWERLRTGVEPALTLKEIGGVGGALAKKAQEIYNGCSKREKVIARRVFLGLIQLGEGTHDTRRRINLEDSLVANGESASQVIEVIRKFASWQARLITVSSEGTTGMDTVEVTHEALIEQWNTLREWLKESREDLRFQRQLEAAANEWDKQGRLTGHLWRSPKLDLLREFERRARADMTLSTVEFFVASDKAEKRDKRLKRLRIIGLVSGLAFMTILSGIAGYKAQQAESRRMWGYWTAAQLADADEFHSLLYGVAAIGLSRSSFIKFPNYIHKFALPTEMLLETPNRSKKFRFVAGHKEGYVMSVAFSPNGQAIASGGHDGTVRLWDSMGNPIGDPMKAEGVGVSSVAFSPDGQTIVSGSEDGTVRLWDKLGNPIVEPWNAVGQKFEGGASIASSPPGVGSVAFSPDGQTIVSGGVDGTVRLWDKLGNPIGKPLGGSGAGIHSVAFSPDGQTIASGHGDGTIQLWDKSGNPMGESWKGFGEFQERPVRSVAFSPDGQTIAIAGDDGVRLWDKLGNPIGETWRVNATVFSVSFSPDGQTIATAVSDGVRLWDKLGNPLGELLEVDGLTLSVAFSPDGQAVVSGHEDSTVRLWSLESNPIGAPWNAHSGSVLSVALSPNGQTIISGGSDGVVRQWDRFGNPIGKPLEGHIRSVSSVALSPHGQTIVSGDIRGTMRLWNNSGNSIGKPLKAHNGGISSVAFSPDGQIIVSSSLDGTMRLWNRSGNSIGKPWNSDRLSTYSVAFSPDGQTIVSSNYGGWVQLWNLEGNPIGEPWKVDSGHISSVAFSPGGQTIIGFGHNGIEVWDKTGNVVDKPFKGSIDLPNQVALSSDGQTIVSGHRDGTVRLWPIWLLEEGLLSYTCSSLKGYLQEVHIQAINISFSRAIHRDARLTCERYAWK